jgi:hypothetical protein
MPDSTSSSAAASATASAAGTANPTPAVSKNAPGAGAAATDSSAPSTASTANNGSSNNAQPGMQNAAVKKKSSKIAALKDKMAKKGQTGQSLVAGLLTDVKVREIIIRRFNIGTMSTP